MFSYKDFDQVNYVCMVLLLHICVELSSILSSNAVHFNKNRCIEPDFNYLV